jgi:hypothetical protein
MFMSVPGRLVVRIHSPARTHPAWLVWPSGVFISLLLQLWLNNYHRHNVPSAAVGFSRRPNSWRPSFGRSAAIAKCQRASDNRSRGTGAEHLNAARPCSVRQAAVHLSHQFSQRLAVIARIKTPVVNVREFNPVRFVATAQPIHFTSTERTTAVEEYLHFEQLTPSLCMILGVTRRFKV